MAASEPQRADETGAVAEVRWIDFSAFYREVEPRIRRALVAAHGVNVGVEARRGRWSSASSGGTSCAAWTTPPAPLPRRAQCGARPAQAAADGAARHGRALRLRPGLPAALQTLTEQQRQAVLLVHGTGCTLAEAATTLDVSVSTLRNHLRRGVAVLRNELGVEVQP